MTMQFSQAITSRLIEQGGGFAYSDQPGIFHSPHRINYSAWGVQFTCVRLAYELRYSLINMYHAPPP
jgi:hypothetical protein